MPRPRSALGASVRPEVPSDLPSPLPISHKSRMGISGLVIFLSAVTFPSFAGLQPGLSDYGWKVGSPSRTVWFSRLRFCSWSEQGREWGGGGGSAAAGGPRGARGPLLRKAGRVPWLVLPPPAAHAYSFKQPRRGFWISPGVISSSSLCLLQFPVAEELHCR